MSKLGIIAGGDDLPKKIIQHCRQTKRQHFVIAFHGQTDPDTTEGTEHTWVNIASVGKALEALKNAGVTDLVMAGKMRRPSLLQLRPDRVGAKWLARIAGKGLGDDGLLRIISEELEKEGFRVIGTEELIGEKILAPKGLIGSIKPNSQSLKDAKRGFEVARALGDVDVGQ